MNSLSIKIGVCFHTTSLQSWMPLVDLSAVCAHQTRHLSVMVVFVQEEEVVGKETEGRKNGGTDFERGASSAAFVAAARVYQESKVTLAG